MSSFTHPTATDAGLNSSIARTRGSTFNFGFAAFTTPPLAAAHSLDAKFTTTAMARELSTWAKFGPPLGHAWEPTDAERHRFSSIRPLIPNDWTVLRIDLPPAGKPAASKPVDLARLNHSDDAAAEREHTPIWHGTLLPETDADIWLASAFAEYEGVVASENAIRASAHGAKLGRRDRDRISLGLFVPASRYLVAVERRGGKDIPLGEIRPDLRSDEWYDIASGKGVLILAELRSRLGAEPFDKLMDEFGRAHAGLPVSSSAFFDAAEKAAGKPLGELKAAWLNGDALSKLGPDVRARKSSGRFWSVDSFERQLDKTLIVYGTLAEADAQREAAQSLQRKLASRWANIIVPIKADNDVDDNILKEHHLLLVGRPATNRLTDRLAKALPVHFGAASFTIAGETYAHPHTAIVAAGPSPLAPDRSVVVFAGLMRPRDVDLPQAVPRQWLGWGGGIGVRGRQRDAAARRANFGRCD